MRMPYHPKEALYIADWLTRQGQVQFEPIRALLQSELAGMTSEKRLPWMPPLPSGRRQLLIMISDAWLLQQLS
jgi:hypothetical protein